MYTEIPLLPYTEPCRKAIFQCRRKRFIVDVEQNGILFPVHSNNSGSMMGLLRRGMPVLLSRSANPKRKLPYSLEAVWVNNGHPADSNGFWCGVNTLTPNRFLKAAFEADKLPFAKHKDGYRSMTPEVKYVDSRFDGRICGIGVPDIWVECKNVTLCEDGIALFPDAVTERGQKHLRGLMDIVRKGMRAVMLYIIERPDCACFAPADLIDPGYARLFYQAYAAGVEICPMTVCVTDQGIFADRVIPVTCFNNHLS